MATKWCTKLEVALKRCPIVFQGHPSNFKVTRLQNSSNLTQIGRFRTVTPVWIHRWLWNDAQSLKQPRGDALLFSKVIHQISRSHGTKHHRFSPKMGRFRTIDRSQLSNPSDLPCWLCCHHRIIMKFSGVITNDQRKVHAKGQGQRSKVKVTEVTTQLNHFRTVTPVWIHIWWWNDAYSLMLLRRGALLFFKVIHQISRSHGSKNRRIWPRLGVSGL